MSKINSDYKEKINKYSSQIKTIENFAEAVRKTPGQYIGYIGNPGYINMVREVFQNSMDELQKEDSPCDHIWVEYYEDERKFVCIDNGRGIPFDNMHRIFAEEHTSSNYVKKDGEFSAGRHGVGAKVTNALSKDFVVESYLCKEASSDGKPHGRYICFHEGNCTTGNGKQYEVDMKNPNNLQGTKVWFTPSTEIMGAITVTAEDVLTLISTLVPLMKLGAVVDFHAVTLNVKSVDRHIVNTNGIVDFLVFRSNAKKWVIPPITFGQISPHMKADIAFTWDSTGLNDEEDVVSFANMCPTLPKSSHVQGFLDGLSNYFRNYMNKIFLPKNSKVVIMNSDIKAGLKAVVSVSHIEPMFSGQAKEIFSNEDIIPFEKELIRVGLDDWMKKNANDVQKLCKYFKSVADLRLKTDTAKIALTKKAVSSISGLPAKYLKPIGKEHLEFILVEGDSALGPCATGRDATRQGIFPLRGKVKNAMTSSKKEFFKNEECAAIHTILNCGEGKNCDPEKCKFEKIIFMGDADVDGLHIRTLLLKMFLVYYRPLVEAGRVYAAVPPLYSIKEKNGNTRYFVDKGDYIKYIYNIFAKSNTVFTSTHKKMNSSELVDLLRFNYNYMEDMTIISNNYAVNPNLLELVYGMIVKKYSVAKIKQVIGKIYKFLDVKVENGILVLDGLVNETVQTVVFNENMLNDCEAKIGKYIREADPNGYYLNEEKMSLYELIKAFHAYTPPNVQRYKGLGEMNAAQLGRAALDPAYDRHLIRYTSDDMKRDIEEIRRMDSNKKDLLEGVDIAGYDL